MTTHLEILKATAPKRKEMTRFNGRDIDVQALCRAATDMLERVSEMTTDEFERGKDRNERRALAIALGLDPDAYALDY